MGDAREPYALHAKARVRAIDRDLDGAVAVLASWVATASGPMSKALAERELPLLAPARGEEVVWFDDDTPAATVTDPNPETHPELVWHWGSDPAPLSGKAALPTGLARGHRRYSFTDARFALAPRAGERVFAFVRLDRDHPPREVAIEWLDATGGRHGAVWGEPLVDLGANGLAPAALPEAGTWVRLEVDAAKLGLEDRLVTGVALHVFDGAAAFDRFGKR